jgi:hypothetical protein
LQRNGVRDRPPDGADRTRTVPYEMSKLHASESLEARVREVADSRREGLRRRGGTMVQPWTVVYLGRLEVGLEVKRCLELGPVGSNDGGGGDPPRSLSRGASGRYDESVDDVHEIGADQRVAKSPSQVF